jgi:signal transduction histidine kinase
MPFFSIRWRLVLSYVLLTLLTVSLLIVLATALMRRNIVQQESDYLQANAQAIARQAGPLLSPAVRSNDLQRLARTSAFFANVRVRILDSQRRPIADSGASEPEAQFVLISDPSRGIDPSNGAGVVSADISSPMWCFAEDARGDSRENTVRRRRNFGPPGDTNVMHVQWKKNGLWGNRVAFEPPRKPPGGSPGGLPGGSSGESPAVQQTATDAQVSVQGGEARSSRNVLLPIENASGSIGFVEVSGGPDVENELLTAAASSLGVAGVVVMAVAALIGLLVSRGLTLPLRRLSFAANRMAQGDLSARAEPPDQRTKLPRDEIAQLARQFDQMASQLEASFAALSSERDALRRFVADASHELRTPIATLKVYNELIQASSANDATTRDEFLAESRAQVNRLEWITDNLLNLSRLDARLAPLDLADHDAGEVLESVARAYKPRAQQKGVALTVEQPDQPITLRCDRAQIELALSNLVDNALKFTPSGGSVALAVKRRGNVVQLAVCDTGIGIAETDKPYIFDRFFQGANSDARGSGLGLAIVKSIVRAHDGQVFVETELDKGSRFVLELKDIQARD